MKSQFSYHILGNQAAYYPQDNFLRNEIYMAWDRLWSKVYKDSNSGYELHSDEFARQDLIAALMYRDEVAAIHLYSFFHLDNLADRNMKYFDFFDQKYIDHLKKRNVETAMSAEFLTVAAKFRKTTVGMPVGMTISQLCMYVFGSINVDAIIAPARNDVGVNKMAFDLGFTCLEKDTQQRGFVCDLIACFQGDQKASADKEVQEWAEELWSKKTVHPSAENILLDSKYAAKKAA